MKLHVPLGSCKLNESELYKILPKLCPVVFDPHTMRPLSEIAFAAALPPNRGELVTSILMLGDMSPQAAMRKVNVKKITRLYSLILAFSAMTT